MSQTTVPALQGAVQGFAGQLADASDNDVVTMVSEESSAEIPMGAMVMQGTADDQALLPTSSAAVMVGIVLHSHQYSKDIELGTTGLKPKACLNILRKGRCLVYSETEVVKGLAAFVRHTAESPDLQTGLFRKDLDTDKAVKVYGVRWAETSSGAGLKLVDVDMLLTSAGNELD